MSIAGICARQEKAKERKGRLETLIDWTRGPFMFVLIRLIGDGSHIAVGVRLGIVWKFRAYRLVTFNGSATAITSDDLLADHMWRYDTSFGRKTSG